MCFYSLSFRIFIPKFLFDFIIITLYSDIFVFSTYDINYQFLLHLAVIGVMLFSIGISIVMILFVLVAVLWMLVIQCFLFASLIVSIFIIHIFLFIALNVLFFSNMFDTYF